ncbi:hypothetical protein L3Y34_013646 [Caenorhabditis briggsae]|uniref:Uncharacterized protein n=1 Tax=Caenorhabditis briggsae TaxID=6238 RepID=A0AAE9CY51_CAEBR|nr:hypothetical protein L3Y34_013646 [Caenorhabditis briggsae]
MNTSSNSSSMETEKNILEQSEQIIVGQLISDLAIADGCNASKKDDEIKKLREEILSHCLNISTEKIVVKINSSGVSDDYKEELKTRIRELGQHIFEKKFDEYYHLLSNFKLETTEAYDSFVKKTKNEAGRAMCDKSTEGKDMFDDKKWQKFVQSRKPNLEKHLKEIKFALLEKMPEVPKELMEMPLAKMFEVFELKYQVDVLKAYVKLQKMQSNIFKKILEQTKNENKQLEYERSVRQQTENLVYTSFADGHTYVLPPPPKAGDRVVPTGKMVRCICKPDCEMTSGEPEYVLFAEIMKRQ